MSLTTKLASLLFAAAGVLAFLAPAAEATVDKLAGNHNETIIGDD
jgi:hypothetical protein